MIRGVEESKRWMEKGSNVEYFDHKGYKSDFRCTENPKLTTVLLAGSNEELGGSEILEWKINIHTHWTKFSHV